jgi:hypothetical protein
MLEAERGEGWRQQLVGKRRESAYPAVAVRAVGGSRGAHLGQRGRPEGEGRSSRGEAEGTHSLGRGEGWKQVRLGRPV